jgi:hypothetical protein
MMGFMALMLGLSTVGVSATMAAGHGAHADAAVAMQTRSSSAASDSAGLAPQMDSPLTRKL